MKLKAAIIFEQAYWQIAMDAVYVGSQLTPTGCSGGCQVIVDSGTSLLTGPAADIKALNTKIGATQMSNGEVGTRDVLFIIRS